MEFEDQVDVDPAVVTGVAADSPDEVVVARPEIVGREASADLLEAFEVEVADPVSGYEIPQEGFDEEGVREEEQVTVGVSAHSVSIWVVDQGPALIDEKRAANLLGNAVIAPRAVLIMLGDSLCQPFSLDPQSRLWCREVQQPARNDQHLSRQAPQSAEPLGAQASRLYLQRGEGQTASTVPGSQPEMTRHLSRQRLMQATQRCNPARKTGTSLSPQDQAVGAEAGEAAEAASGCPFSGMLGEMEARKDEEISWTTEALADLRIEGSEASLDLA